MAARNTENETLEPDPDSSQVGPISSLIPAVARLHRARAAALLRELELSPGQELLLMMLWEQEPRQQSEITREFAVEPPTTAKMLARMEKNGFISRARSAEDRRMVLVSLTAKGRSLREPVEKVWAQLEAETVAGLTQEQQETLETLLRMMIAHLPKPGSTDETLRR